MRMSPKARMKRLFTHGRCLDVAIDHGVCNEPSFMAGLEDIGGVVDQLIAAGPDAIQMNYGQADLLQSRPEKGKPALVMRIDMGNPYNDQRHRVMWAELQNADEPIIGALEMDAACVVVNLFMLPDEPDLFRQCVANIAATRAACARFGMPLMIEPLVMLPNDVRGGYQVDGDADKIVTLVRLAAEMGADIIKADPTSDPGGLSPRHRGRPRAGPGARRRQGGPAQRPQKVRRTSRPGRPGPRLRPQHLPARQPAGGGRRAYGDDPPRRLRRRGLGDLPGVAEAGLLLGLDAGNTVVKAVLFDREGNQLAASQRDGASRTPAPGHVERDLDELWANAAVVIRECLERAGCHPGAVAAVGCAGHGNGLYLLDREGAPLLAIQSIDTRAAREAEGLGAGGNGARLHAICLQAPWPAQTPTLLAWMRHHAPDIYARAGTAFMCKDFVAWKLTGRRVTDISDMSGAGLLRLPDCSYDSDLLERYGLADARDMLPDLVGPTDIVGGITAAAAAATGLAEGTPVVGGLFDVVASALGSGASAPGEASIIAGTWSINQVVIGDAVTDPRVFMVSSFGPDRFMAIESSATSAANLEWYVRELVERGGHHPDPFGECGHRIDEVTPAADDPYFHPFLYGSGQGAFMRAGFYGIAGWHGEGHLLRALFEGVAFEHRRHVGVLKDAGIRFDRASLSGGAARSPVWPQIFADVLGIPVAVATCAETGALGAAIAAGTGIGVFPDLAAGVRAMSRPRAAITPDPEMTAHHDTRYETYRMLTAAMTPLWQRIAAARQEA